MGRIEELVAKFKDGVQDWEGEIIDWACRLAQSAAIIDCAY